MNSTVQLIEMFSADGTIHHLNYSCMIFNFQGDSCILFKQHNTEQDLYSIKHFQVNETNLHLSFSSIKSNQNVYYVKSMVS